MKILILISALFLTSCALPIEQRENEQGGYDPVPRCSDSVECGVIAAAAVGTKMIQSNKKVPAKKGVVIQCRISQQDSPLQFPCGTTQTTLNFKNRKTEVFHGTGEFISIPPDALEDLREVSIKTRGCPNSLRLRDLKPGSQREIVFQADCSDPL